MHSNWYIQCIGKAVAQASRMNVSSHMFLLSQWFLQRLVGRPRTRDEQTNYSDSVPATVRLPHVARHNSPTHIRSLLLVPTNVEMQSKSQYLAFRLGAIRHGPVLVSQSFHLGSDRLLTEQFWRITTWSACLKLIVASAARRDSGDTLHGTWFYRINRSGTATLRGHTFAEPLTLSDNKIETDYLYNCRILQTFRNFRTSGSEFRSSLLATPCTNIWHEWERSQVQAIPHHDYLTT